MATEENVQLRNETDPEAEDVIENQQVEEEKPVPVVDLMEDDDIEDDEFVVEKILDHKKKKDGTFKYLVKWQGFNDEDNTWENEENFNDKELIDDYWKSKPRTKEGQTRQEKNKKRKTDDDSYGDKDFQNITLDHDYPPEDLEDWESEVIEVETIERNAKDELIVYLVWKNGCHTAHLNTIANKKVPQKIIEFYQNHLKFLDEKN